MPTIAFDHWFRGRSAATPTASRSTDFGRAYRGSLGVPIVGVPVLVELSASDGWGAGFGRKLSATLGLADDPVAASSSLIASASAGSSDAGGACWGWSIATIPAPPLGTAFAFDHWFRGRPVANAAASPSTSFGRAYRGSLGLPVIRSSTPTSVLVYGRDGWGLVERTALSTLTTIAVASMDAFGIGDGWQPSSGGFNGLFDAFTDGFGVHLESHAPTNGTGSWAKHPSYASGRLQMDGYNRLHRGNTIPSPAIYLASETVEDGAVAWLTGDDDVVYIADAQCGCGLRVSDSADDGYFAVGYNDETIGSSDWAIVKRLGGIESILAWTPKPPLVLTATTLEFSAAGPNLALKVDGVLTLAATDGSIVGPGRFAVLFRPYSVPDGAGSWIDDVSFAGDGAARRLGPERVSASASFVDAYGWAERWSAVVTASASLVVSADAAGLGERARIAAATASAAVWAFADGARPDSGGLDLYDDFDGGSDYQPLEDHTPDGGGAWTRHPLYSTGGGAVSLETATVPRTGVPDPILYLATPAAADCRAAWTTGDDGATSEADAFAGIGLRVSDSADTGYFAGSLNESGSFWAILKRVAGVETTLATAAKPSLVLPSASLEFSAVGPVLTLKVDGAQVASAVDATIPGPGRLAMAFRFHPTPQTSGSWIDSVSFGAPGSATRPGPERIAAGLSGRESAGWSERWSSVVSTSFTQAFSADSGGASERGAVAAAAGSVDSHGGSTGSRLAAVAGAWEASGAGDSWTASAAARGREAAELGDHAALGAAIGSGDAAGWTVRTHVVAGVAAVGAFDLAGLAEAWRVQIVLATLTYTIYGNDGDGGPIDYATPLGTTTTTSWDTPPLEAPGVHRFGVRVTSAISGLEEENIDAVVEIALDGAGVDVTARPRPVFNLRAYPLTGGLIRVEWAHPGSAGPTRPAGFRVYVGSPTPDYGAPSATVPATGGRLAGTYRADLAGLSDGTTYAVAVRAYNATAEEPNPAYVLAKSDATPPDAIDGLSGAASAVDLP
ncbi:fibronectin type III domain-containing protein [Paludisphaera soli]|uniref:fibronectin type III domain-containing protein n=1 Tax=Paludisphaera soli TaxID=2712865 RepID=UPI0013EBE6B6|nr:fibronectin type III domain-containing protein [Paludisphaera soli]